MSFPDDDLEALVPRPARREVRPGSAPPAEIGLCDCGARITAADVFGEQGGADLGQPRRPFGTRVFQYRCSLCGRTGEFPACLVEG